jgi:hypothetical protein
MSMITVHRVLLVRFGAAFAVLSYQYLTVQPREDELYIGNAATSSETVAPLCPHSPSVIYHLSKNLGERGWEVIMSVYHRRFGIRWQGNRGYSR